MNDVAPTCDGTFAIKTPSSGIRTSRKPTTWAATNIGFCVPCLVVGDCVTASHINKCPKNQFVLGPEETLLRWIIITHLVAPVVRWTSPLGIHLITLRYWHVVTIYNSRFIVFATGYLQALIKWLRSTLDVFKQMWYDHWKSDCSCEIT